MYIAWKTLEQQSPLGQLKFIPVFDGKIAEAPVFVTREVRPYRLEKLLELFSFVLRKFHFQKYILLVVNDTRIQGYFSHCQQKSLLKRFIFSQYSSGLVSFISKSPASTEED